MGLTVKRTLEAMRRRRERRYRDQLRPDVAAVIAHSERVIARHKHEDARLARIERILKARAQG